MALIFNGSPANSLTGNTAKPSRVLESAQRTSDGPPKEDDQVAASLQKKGEGRGVSADLAKRVGGVKPQEEGRLDRSPEKGIDRVSVSVEGLAAASAGKSRTSVDSSIAPAVDGAPGLSAVRPHSVADPFAFDRTVAATTSRGAEQPTGADATPLFSERSGVSFGGKG